MTEEEFLAIAAAVLDGTPVAWDTLPEPETALARGLLQQLRLLDDVTRLHRAAQSPIGRSWGPLVLAERIGAGSFGEVHRARDTSLERDVALKLLRSPTANRHLAEGRLLARVRHPNVVTVFGAAEHDGTSGIWMEFVRGRTLRDLVAERGPFTSQDVIAIGVDLSRALAAVHASGLLHGDIKAQNVMREDDGRIVLMDFGTGRIAGHESLPGPIVGTPLYAAPEILNGEPARAASDVYSVGVLLHFLLTGAFPVSGRTLAEVRAAHASGPRKPLVERRPDVPRRLAAVIDRATAAAQVERFQTAADLERALVRAGTTRVTRRSWIAAASLSAVVAVGAWLGSRTVPDSTALTVNRVWEGTDVDVLGAPSPDGRYLSHVDWETGDLAVRDLRAGVSRHLTQKGSWQQSQEYAEFSVFSPDSSQIAYAWFGKDGRYELRTVHVDRPSPRIVYNDAGLRGLRPVAWTASDHILCIINRHDEAAQLVLLPAASPAPPRVLTTFDFGWPQGVSLSPDGRVVLYDRQPDRTTRARDVFALTLDDAREASIVTHPANDVSPQWTPDGKSVVFVSNRSGMPDLWAVDMRSGHPSEPRLVKSAVPVTQLIAFTRAGVLYYGTQTSKSDVYVATYDPAAGAVVTAPTTIPRSFAGRNIAADWSPDGRDIVYLSQRDADDVTARVLTVLRIDTGKERTFPTPAPYAQTPRWSPDGRSILYVTQSATGGAALYLLDPATGTSTATLALDQAAGTVAPAWLPDARRVVFTLEQGRQQHLAIADLRSKQIRVIYRPETPQLRVGDAAVSPSGQSVAFRTITADERYATSVRILPLAGGTARELFHVESPVTVAVGLTWTPDGRSLLFARSQPPAHTPAEVWRADIDSGGLFKTGLAADSLRYLRLHPDGRRLAFAVQRSRAEVWAIRNLMAN